MTILRHSLNDALGDIGVSPLQIVDDEEIEKAIVVDVDPNCCDGPQRPKFRIVNLVESGLLRRVGKCTVAVVVIKSVAMDAGDKDVRVAVVVVVADGHAYIKP